MAEPKRKLQVPKHSRPGSSHRFFHIHVAYPPKFHPSCLSFNPHASRYDGAKTTPHPGAVMRARTLESSWGPTQHCEPGDARHVARPKSRARTVSSAYNPSRAALRCGVPPRNKTAPQGGAARVWLAAKTSPGGLKCVCPMVCQTMIRHWGALLIQDVADRPIDALGFPQPEKNRRLVTSSLL